MNLQNIKLTRPLWHAVVVLGLALVCNAAYAERADRDKPAHLEADRASIDDAKQISIFEGNVQLTQGTLTLRGDKLVVVQDKEGRMHGTASGRPASFRQKREGVDEFVEGYGERVEYDAKNETVDFFFQAGIKRGQDEVHGDHITYSSRTEIFQVFGAPGTADSPGKNRVRIIMQPKGKGAGADPAAEPLPIKPADVLPQPNDQGNSPP